MKRRTVLSYLVVIIFLLACATLTGAPKEAAQTQPVDSIEVDSTPAPVEDINPTATAADVQAPFKSAMTADALTAAARPSNATPSVRTFAFSVPASACWIDSQVNVLTGQKITISASGSVNTYGGNQGSNSDPDGQKSICGAVQCPVQGKGYGALIGRVADGKPFFIGKNMEFQATRDGLLSFTVNDWECQDNSGAFTLMITVE